MSCHPQYSSAAWFSYPLVPKTATITSLRWKADARSTTNSQLCTGFFLQLQGFNLTQDPPLQPTASILCRCLAASPAAMDALESRWVRCRHAPVSLMALPAERTSAAAGQAHGVTPTLAGSGGILKAPGLFGTTLLWQLGRKLFGANQALLC